MAFACVKPGLYDIVEASIFTWRIQLKQLPHAGPEYKSK